MTTYVIRNRVPSADEMGRTLGLSKKRVASVKVIMNSPASTKSRKRTSSRTVSTKKASAKLATGRKSGR